MTWWFSPLSDTDKPSQITDSFNRTVSYCHKNTVLNLIILKFVGPLYSIRSGLRENCNDK